MSRTAIPYRPVPARYQIGDRIVYRGDFGTGPQTSATVTGTGQKNGRSLVDLDNGHWAYTSQILGLYEE